MSSVTRVLEDAKCGMFGEREDTTEALKYAHSLVSPEDKGAMTIAIMVYHNTLLNQIIEGLK